MGGNGRHELTNEFQRLVEQMNINSDMLQALDERLLDHTTGSGLITIDEYERWRVTGSLSHIQDVFVVHDAAAAVFSKYGKSTDFASYLAFLRQMGLSNLANKLESPN